jgi:NADH-quinone oxidoreductase subunit I
MSLGLGTIRGLGITFRHLIDSFTIGHNEQPAAAGDLPPILPDVRGGMPARTGGIFTVQYPDQKLPTPERFRFYPFLVYEEEPESERAQFDGIRCTACGICAKVCPPQCIWIVQGKGADGRPRPVCTEFYIDTSICMQCGFCVEYCPFEAIKMDHEFELSSYERWDSWVMDLQRLLHPVEYHAAIHPADYGREVAERREKEEARRRKEQAAAAAAEGGESEEELKRRKAEQRKAFLEARAKRKTSEEGATGSEPTA